jgi:hypothetical protein
MKRTLLINAIAFFFILLFLYTGIVKLTEIKLFREQLLSSPFLGSAAGIIALALPIAEILLSIALLVPAWQLRGLYATLLTMGVFTVYVIAILFVDNHLSCSCGGIIEDLTPRQHVLFNIACVVLSLIGILLARRKQPTIRFQRLTGSTAIALFLVIGWALFSAFSSPYRVRTGMEGRLLPSFDLLLIDSSYVNTKDIPTGKPLILIGFSPTCTHCGAEADDLLKNIDRLKDARIYFVTPFPYAQMRGFFRYFRMKRYPNVSMGRDSSDLFLPYFKASGVPFTAVFDSQKRLKKAFDGQTNADALAKAILE